jgi:GDP-4-dehydro-6-deoxy-D-mannose reductase
VGDLQGKRVWVTGAGGFVGRVLVPALQAAGAEVTPTDDDLDVRDPALMTATLRRLQPAAVIHLAAMSSVAASMKDARNVYDVNFQGGRALLTAAEEAAPETRILLIGSGAIYGSSEPGAAPFDESAPLRPASPYAWTKACTDLLGAHYASRGLDVVRVRPFNHTGPGQSDAFVAASFARQLAEMEAGKREPVMRVGNLDSIRDFLPVEDVVDAYVRLLDPDVPAETYNVASGEGTSAGDILGQLVASSSVSPTVEVDPERVRPTDVAVGDAKKLSQATGWSPSGRLSDTLAALLDHARGHGDSRHPASA